MSENLMNYERIGTSKLEKLVRSLSCMEPEKMFSFSEESRTDVKWSGLE